MHYILYPFYSACVIHACAFKLMDSPPCRSSICILPPCSSCCSCAFGHVTKQYAASRSSLSVLRPPTSTPRRNLLQPTGTAQGCGGERGEYGWSRAVTSYEVAFSALQESQWPFVPLLKCTSSNSWCTQGAVCLDGTPGGYYFRPGQANVWSFTRVHCTFTYVVV